MIKQGLFGAFLVIFVGGFLLVWDSPPDAFKRNQTPQVDRPPLADSYMTEITSRQFSDTGKEKFILFAPKVELFSDASETPMKGASARNGVSHCEQIRALTRVSSFVQGYTRIQANTHLMRPQLVSGRIKIRGTQSAICARYVAYEHCVAAETPRDEAV